MQKLKLDLDSLDVQTFEVAGDVAHDDVMALSGWTNCGGVTCLMSLCPDCGGTDFTV